MREILFRGKTRNGEWKFGTGLLYDSMHTWLVNNPLHKAIAFGEEHYQVIPETVGQYTGLTANGKKIFEGDIVYLTDVRYNNEWKAVVTFGNPYSQYNWGWNFQYIGEKPKVNTDILCWLKWKMLKFIAKLSAIYTTTPNC